MKSKFSKILILIFLFILFLSVSGYVYATNIFYDLSSNIFRLHILANSDSKEDQELKLKVRDEIINYLKPLTKNCKNKSEVIDIISRNIQELQKVAIKTIKNNGYDYNVTLEIGNFYFPTKYYGNISMPSRKIRCFKNKNWSSKTVKIGGVAYFHRFVFQIFQMDTLIKLLKKI